MTSKNNNIKNILIYGFFFLFPILGPITPEFNFALGSVNADMLWLFLLSGLMFYLILAKKFIYYSSTFKFLILYYAFFFINAYFNGYFGSIVKTDIALYITSCFAILLIDNLTYDKSDLKRLYKLMSILVFITLTGSLLQYYVDHSLFVVSERFGYLTKIDFQGFWRNGSIFDSLIQNQGGIAFIMLLFIFLKKDYQTFDFKRTIPILFLLLIGYLTFTRYVIISQFIIIIFYIVFIYFRSGNVFLRASYTTLIVSIILLFYSTEIIESDFIQGRLFADATGRTKDPLDFINQYLGTHNILSGTGVSSFMSENFYGNIRRLHAGVWDLFFQGGIIGLFLWSAILYTFHKKAFYIHKISKDSRYLIVVPIIFLINLTARVNHFFFFGFLLIYLILTIQVELIKRKKVQEFEK